MNRGKLLIAAGSVLGILAILANASSAIAQYENIKSYKMETGERANRFENVKRNTKYCEQMLDGVYVRDEARKADFCRTVNGFVKL